MALVTLPWNLLCLMDRASRKCSDLIVVTRQEHHHRAARVGGYHKKSSSGCVVSLHTAARLVFCREETLWKAYHMNAQVGLPCRLWHGKEGIHTTAIYEFVLDSWEVKAPAFWDRLCDKSPTGTAHPA